MCHASRPQMAFLQLPTALSLPQMHRSMVPAVDPGMHVTLARVLAWTSCRLGPTTRNCCCESDMEWLAGRRCDGGVIPPGGGGTTPCSPHPKDASTSVDPAKCESKE